MSGRLEKLLQQKRKHGEQEIDELEDRKSDWVKRIDSLYVRIENWLRPLVDHKEVKLMKRQVHMHEELLGDYAAFSMRIHFLHYDRYLDLIPKGLHVVGANGRIDVIFDSSDQDIKIIGRPKSEEWEIAFGYGKDVVSKYGMTDRQVHDAEYDIGWRLGTGRYRIVAFNQENFESLLETFISTF